MSDIDPHEQEQRFREEFRAYLKELFERWLLLLTIIFGSSVWVFVPGGTEIMPAWATSLIPVLLIACASFIVWREQYRKVKILSGQVETLTRDEQRRKIDQIAAKYVHLFAANGMPRDAYIRLDMLLQSGVREIEETPNGLPEVIKAISLKGTSDPLSNFWKMDGLFPFLEWVVQRGVTLAGEQFYEEYWGDVMLGNAPPLPIAVLKVPDEIEIGPDDEDDMDYPTSSPLSSRGYLST